uniref:Uncharacterized protein n=1 Tax=Hanusia phi TaxID=3032 RepID=A0A7S0F320_9CRYP
MYLYLQLCFWLNFPVAMVKMRDGSQEFDDAYYQVVKSGKFLFGWYQPDDNLLGTKQDTPISLMLPPYNALEQLNGIYKTGNEFVKPRNYVWRKLPSIDPHVTFFATNLNLYDEDMNALMAESGRMKNVTSDIYLSSWSVACRWVRQSQAVWETWIPAICEAGKTADPTLSSCVGCPAGFYCQGGIELAQPCPKGKYCPANSSAPMTCPTGLQTNKEKMTQESDCIDCVGGNYLINGRCTSLSILVISIIVPLLVLMVFSVKGLKLLRRYYLPQEKKLLMNTMKELRNQLLINKKNGFYLSDENVEIWVDKQSIVCIQSDSMEAACRLALLQDDLDLFFFDNFCATLCQFQQATSDEQEISAQHEKLREWLLSIAVVLLDTNEADQRILTGENEEGQVDNVVGALFFSPDATEVSTARSCLEEEPEDRRFRYFLEKFIKAKIWAEDEVLFERLQEICRANVEAMRSHCEERYSQLIDSPSGSKLEQLCWRKEDKEIIPPQNPKYGREKGFSSSSTNLNVWSKYASGFMEGMRSRKLHMLRQDSYEVRAIEVDEASKVESKVAFRRLAERGEAACVDEDVFITQLQQQAQRLNASFHSCIFSVILQRCRKEISSGFTSSALFDLKTAQVAACRMVDREAEIAVVFPSCKTVKSMKEKLQDMAPPHHAAIWPLTANFLDPVRMCVICQDAADMLEVFSWLEEHEKLNEKMKICTIVNGFSREEGNSQWRGLKVFVRFEDKGGSRIIGEIQLQDKRLFALNTKMCKLETLLRSSNMKAFLSALEAIEEQ